MWDRDVARLVWTLSKVKKVQPEHATAYAKFDGEQRRLFAIFAPDIFGKIAATVPALRILKKAMQ